MRADIERSLARTLADRNPAMKQAGITPFAPFDTKRQPNELQDYENHRYMMDWWTSDWGDPLMDAGHFKQRNLAGQQIMGMNRNGNRRGLPTLWSMAHWRGGIRQDDYRPFLLACTGTCATPWIRETAMLPRTLYCRESPRGGNPLVVVGGDQ